jgi:drug/metabolite transporter (DMT)-like permease
MLVVAMGILWGCNWVAARIMLNSLGPWTVRAAGIGLGMATLFTVAWLGRISLKIPPGQRWRVFVASIFNVSLFSVCAAYSQVTGTTSRAIVIAYSMPIWTALLARLVLKEKFTPLKLLAIALCVGGLVILIWPLTYEGASLGALLALVCAISWAIGTIFMKQWPIDAPPLTSGAWQLLCGSAVLAPGMAIFEGLPHVWPLPWQVVAATAFNGFLGMGLTYFLWFVIVHRVSATTAGLGTLLVPAVGVIASAIILGERPPLHECIGFALIFAAAATVLLQPSAKPPEMPE